MIMARNEDGTYSQVGFVKDNAGIDTEYIYDKDGDIVFEKGFTRETSGTVPLTINGIGKDLKAWRITGNTVQNGTPTPENPVEVWGCGDYDSETGLYKIPVVTRGKNLFDKENASPKAVTNQGVFVNNSSYISSNYISVSPNTTYTKIPIIKSSQFHDLCEYDENKIFIRHIFTANNGTFTTSEKTKYIVFNIAKFNIDIAQLEKGSTATPYEPYHEPITTPIYLDSPLYKIGDYADRLSKTEEVRVVNELVLTGEENFSYDDTYTRFTLKIPNARATSNRSDETPCTHYISIHDGRSIYDVPDDSIYVTVGGGYVYINIKDITYTSLADFKSYLAAQYAAGTPVKVYYVMKTPETKTVEPVEIPTLNGTTVIDVDTAVKPTEMYTKYKSSK